MKVIDQVFTILVTAFLTSGWWAAAMWLPLHNGAAFTLCALATAAVVVVFFISNWDK